ncbi:MAG TPA: type II secretion system protein N [Gammaproteobacteria bacterium]|nr:type II secretion system protein N [Gammaproteobacteria bacterium]
MRPRYAAFGLLLACGGALADTPDPGIVLTGVILDGQDSVALISEKAGADRSYRIGDPVPGGARLAAIEANYVTLEFQGKKELLGFGGLGVGRLPPSGTPPVRAFPAHADAFLVPMEGITYISDTHFILSREKVRGFLNSPDAMKDARWLLQKDGSLFIERIREGSVYEKAGLRVGDVITSINDAPLKDSNQVMGLYADLDKMQHLDLTIERMGQEQHLLYDIK